MTIIEGSKILAEYLGWRYYGFKANSEIKPGWYYVTHIPIFVASKSKFVKLGDSSYGKLICRHHAGLRFYNSYDSLFEVIDKLEKENLSQWMYSWEQDDEIQYNFQSVEVNVDTSDVYVCIDHELDPPTALSKDYPDMSKRQKLFWSLVDAVKYINNLKNDNS